jgi:hypothetical protein
MDPERKVPHEEPFTRQGDDEDKIDETFDPGSPGFPVQKGECRQGEKDGKTAEENGNITESRVLRRQLASLGKANAPAEGLHDDLGENEDRRQGAHRQKYIFCRLFPFHHGSSEHSCFSQLRIKFLTK